MDDLRILVADDDPLMGELICEQLGLAGFETVHVPSGREALRRLSDEEGFDAVVSDLHMPEGTGFDVLDGVRARIPALPVVLVSAFPSPEIRERARMGGAVAMLAKPFSARELIEALARGLKPAEAPPARLAPPHPRSTP